MYPWAELRLLSSSLAVVLKTIQLITSMDVWQTSKICWKWTFFFFGLICSDSVSASRIGCIKCLTKVKGIFKKPTHLQRKEKTKLEYVRNIVNIFKNLCSTTSVTQKNVPSAVVILLHSPRAEVILLLYLVRFSL